MEEKKKTVIWGTGRYGTVAYHYYKNLRNILYFVDSNCTKWGLRKEGIEICSPDILLHEKVDVIIAVKNDTQSILEQLRKYPERTVLQYKIEEELVEIEKTDRVENFDPNTIVVCFWSGLGNQMFMYALMRKYIAMGKKVVADTSGIKKFAVKEMIIDQVFPAVTLKQCGDKIQRQFGEYQWENLPLGSKILMYQEPSVLECKEKKTDMSILYITGGVIRGYHQTYLFADSIRDILLQEFSFPYQSDIKLCELMNQIQKQRSVSVHVRAYPSDHDHEILYGDNCSKEYYQKAIQYILQKEPECQLYVFSDNIEKTKRLLAGLDAIFVQPDMFDQYEDWYDMFLMSCCTHNIIASSSFSWWGAWLNRNPDKIVVAPKHYNVCCDLKDIYPSDWVRI